MGDLDRVAVVQRERSDRDCGRYRTMTGAEARTLSITIENLHMRVYDRRSGKQESERIFYAPQLECPSFATARGGYVGGLSTEAKAADAFPWLAQLVQAPSP